MRFVCKIMRLQNTAWGAHLLGQGGASPSQCPMKGGSPLSTRTPGVEGRQGKLWPFSAGHVTVAPTSYLEQRKELPGTAWRMRRDLGPFYDEILLVINMLLQILLNL